VRTTATHANKIESSEGDKPARCKPEDDGKYYEGHQWSLPESCYPLDNQVSQYYIPHKLNTHLVFCLILHMKDTLKDE